MARSRTGSGGFFYRGAVRRGQARGGVTMMRRRNRPAKRVTTARLPPIDGAGMSYANLTYRAQSAQAPRPEERFQTVLDLVDLTGAEAVLDYGCGDGYFLGRL